MNNTTPPEIKKWIKGYADAHDFLRSDINEIIVKALTSLYQHLQENGRVAELEKDKECLIKEAIRFGADNVLVFSETDVQVEDLYEQFIKENPIYKP